jgi:hypothetical protein
MVAHWSVPSPQRYRETRQCAQRKFLIWVNIVVRVNIMKSVLWIRIRFRIEHFKWIRIWIRFQILIRIQIRIWIQSFDDQKLKKKLKFFSFIFLIKNCTSFIPRPPLWPPSYRRSLLPSKENTKHFKRWILLSYLPFWIRAWIQGPCWIRIQIQIHTLDEIVTAD